jgi:hypothetical protein
VLVNVPNAGCLGYGRFREGSYRLQRLCSTSSLLVQLLVLKLSAQLIAFALRNVCPIAASEAGSVVLAVGLWPSRAKETAVAAEPAFEGLGGFEEARGRGWEKKDPQKALSGHAT